MMVREHFIYGYDIHVHMSLYVILAEYAVCATCTGVCR